jgi:Domain of unknown function (DUF4399)
MDVPRMASLSAALALLLPFAAHAQGTPAPKNAEIYIISPEDNATVTSPFKCRFGLSNMGVTHSGDAFPDAGHHHLVIDVDTLPDPNEPIPLDKNHLHFGHGETEALVDLPPGRHTLRLVLGDARHYVFSPPVVSKPITVWVRSMQHQARPRVRHRRRHEVSVEARRKGGGR